MKWRNMKFISVLCILIFLLNGCSMPISTDWEVAKKENTVAAYKTFIRKYPRRRLTYIAEKRIEVLKKREDRAKDDAKWKIAKDLNTVASYEKYLKEYRGEKKYKKEAESLKKALMEDVLYQKIINLKSSDSAARYFDDYPKGKYISSIFKKLSKKNLFYQPGKYKYKFRPRKIEVIKSFKQRINEGFFRIIDGGLQTRYTTKIAKKGYSFLKIRCDIYNGTKNKKIKKSDIYLIDGSKKYPVVSSKKYFLRYYAFLRSLSLRSSNNLNFGIGSIIHMEFIFDEVSNKKLDKLYLAYKGKKTIPIKKVMKMLKQINYRTTQTK